MTRLITAALLALLAAAACVASGYLWATSNARETVLEAEAETARYLASASDLDAALRKVKRDLAADRQRHAALARDAEAAIAGRDAEILRLRQGAESTFNAIKGARRDAECAALADLPVCNAVADRLWPSEAANGQPARGD